MDCSDDGNDGFQCLDRDGRCHNPQACYADSLETVAGVCCHVDHARTGYPQTCHPGRAVVLVGSVLVVAVAMYLPLAAVASLVAVLC